MSLAHNGKSPLLWALSGIPLGLPVGLRGNEYEPSYLLRLGEDCENTTFFSPFVGQWSIYDHQLYADTAAALDEVGSEVENGIVIVRDVAGYEYTTLQGSLEAHQRNGLYMRGENQPLTPQRFEQVIPVDLVVDGADSFDVPANWDKHACWRVHNMQPRAATVTFGGGYVLQLNPWDCKSFRRDTPLGPYRQAMRYFWPFSPQDPRWLTFTGTQMSAGTFASANNIGNPIVLLDWMRAMGAQIDPTEPGQPPNAVLDKFCRLTDENARIGDMLYHKGKFWSVKYDSTQLIEKKEAEFTGIANLASDLSKISAGYSVSGGLELIPDSNVDSHDVVGIETNLFPSFPSQPSGYIPCSVVIPQVAFRAVTVDVNAPVTTPLADVASLYASTITSAGYSPSETALRWSPMGPLLISRVTYTLAQTSILPAHRVYYDWIGSGRCAGPEYTNVFSQQIPEPWPLPFVAGFPSFVGYTTPAVYVHSCLQKRSYAPMPTVDGQEQSGVGGRIGGIDITIGSLPTVDVDIKRQGWAFDGGGFVPTFVRKAVLTEGDNLRNILLNGLQGTQLTLANRGAFLGATTPADAETSFVLHRVQFNDYNLLAWCVNAWRRHRPMATYDLAPFLLEAPGDLFSIGNGIRKVPVRLDAAGYAGGFGDTFSGRESATDFSITRTLLSPANDDLDDLERKRLGWWIAEKFGWPERENTAFHFTPHRTGQTFQRWYIDLESVRDWAVAQGLQHSIIRSGFPWKPVFRATNDLFPPPDQFDTIQYFDNDGTDGEQNTDEDAMLVSVAPSAWPAVPPTVERFTLEIRPGIVRNIALVKTGQTQMIDPGTVTVANDGFVVRDHQYIDLD
jgi:hypothetical protein